jgi:hypothetical protein
MSPVILQILPSNKYKGTQQHTKTKGCSQEGGY